MVPRTPLVALGLRGDVPVDCGWLPPRAPETEEAAPKGTEQKPSEPAGTDQKSPEPADAKQKAPEPAAVEPKNPAPKGPEPKVPENGTKDPEQGGPAAVPDIVPPDPDLEPEKRRGTAS